MGTLIKIKAEIVNPELPVITEQGILPYYTGIYVNKLAEKGVTLTQTEINAVTAFINSLIEADVIDKIGTFYPYIGNPNVPLIGSKEYVYDDVTPNNKNLDFVDGKLRGYKKLLSTNGIKLGDLAATDFGVMFGGSMITKVPSGNVSVVNALAYFSNKQETLAYVQLRFATDSLSPTNFKFAICAKDESQVILNRTFSPSIDRSNVLHNFTFAYGLSNVPPEVTDVLRYNRTCYRNGVQIANAASNNITGYITNNNLTNLTPQTSSNQSEWVMTTFAYFNSILTEDESAAFCKALNTFTAAVGKTVSVG
jgi:hypothetical protein